MYNDNMVLIRMKNVTSMYLCLSVQSWIKLPPPDAALSPRPPDARGSHLKTSRGASRSLVWPSGLASTPNLQLHIGNLHRLGNPIWYQYRVFFDVPSSAGASHHPRHLYFPLRSGAEPPSHSPGVHGFPGISGGSAWRRLPWTKVLARMPQDSKPEC